MVPQPLRYLFVALIVAMFSIPIFYARYYENQTRNFHVVREGVLYRSGQMSLDGLKTVIHDHGIKTVISCRSARIPGDPPPDAEEEAYCYKTGIKFCRLPYKPFVPDKDGNIPADENASAFLEIMNNPKNHPVLVHCFGGRHRAGMLCAVYRLEFDNWPRESVMAEMIVHGYDNLDEHQDVVGYLTKYQPMNGDSCPFCRHVHLTGAAAEECCHEPGSK
jgi:tyrosine-protein phosphatase SIW14